MTITNAAVAVTGVRSVIYDAGDGPAVVKICNLDTNPTVYVGDAGVTVANGYPIPAGEAEDFQVFGSGDDLYVIGDGNATVRRFVTVR